MPISASRRALPPAPSVKESWYEQFAVRFLSVRKKRDAEIAHQRAATPSFKVLESPEFRAKIAFEVRDWCLRWECSHLGDDLIQDALVHIAGRLPDYRPGAASVETWVFAKPRGVLYGFLNNYGRSGAFSHGLSPSIDTPSGKFDEDGESLSIHEVEESIRAREEFGEGVYAGKVVLTDASGLLRSMVLDGQISERDACVWFYRHGLDSEGQQRPHDVVAAHFDLTPANVRQIARRTSGAIQVELNKLGLVAPSGRRLDPGHSGPLPSEEERHDEWMRERDDFWREFRNRTPISKKDAA